MENGKWKMEDGEWRMENGDDANRLHYILINY
jgi:hypothetical protein